MTQENASIAKRASTAPSDAEYTTGVCVASAVNSPLKPINMENNQTPSECKYYKDGGCEHHLPYHRCCMRIVKPMTECFYYQPKEKKRQ